MGWKVKFSQMYFFQKTPVCLMNYHFVTAGCIECKKRSRLTLFYGGCVGRGCGLGPTIPVSPWVSRKCRSAGWAVAGRMPADVTIWWARVRLVQTRLRNRAGKDWFNGSALRLRTRSPATRRWWHKPARFPTGACVRESLGGFRGHDSRQSPPLLPLSGPDGERLSPAGLATHGERFGR